LLGIFRAVLGQGGHEAATLRSGDYNDQALIELEPRGTLTIPLHPVTSSYSRHVGDSNTMDQATLTRGNYAVRVFVHGLGGTHSRLVPVTIR
jgi:hypothetical protein